MRKASFGFAKPEESTGFLLWQTTITWQRLVKRELDVHQVSHAQFVLMALLLWFEEHHQQPTQVALVDKSKLDKMTVSKSLKTLALQGLVERVEHEKDTRAKRATLTKSGKALVKQLIPLVEKTDTAFFAALSLQEQTAFAAMLTKLASFDNEPPKKDGRRT